MHRIIDAAHGQYKVLFHLAAFTGMRGCELAGLYVQDIDFGRGIVRVQRSLTYGIEGPTKNRKTRIAYLDSATLRTVQQFVGDRTAGRLFQSASGRPLDMHDVSRRVLAGICDKLAIPRAGLHSFRHGRVSLMQANRLPADFMLSQVGHSSLKVASIYTHFTADQMREMTEQLAPNVVN
jgi:integrase